MRDDYPWYDSTVASLRRIRRHAERKWRRLRTMSSRLEYISARRAVVSRVTSRKVEYYKQRVAACGGDQRKLFALLNGLLHRNSAPVLPPSASDADLASCFSDFFVSKISRIRSELDSAPVNEVFSVDFSVNVVMSATLSAFQPVRDDTVLLYIGELNKTYCQLDPINVSKIPSAYKSAAPFMAKIINKCFEESTFVLSEKEALV